MSRDQDDVLLSMQESIAAIDPTISTDYGPIYETSLVPFSTESSYVEGLVEHLASLYQLENINNLSDEEVEQIGENFGQEYGEGEPSQGYLTFWAMEAPTVDIDIPVGTLCSTEDGTYVYQTLEAVTMYSATAIAYYNSSNRRYEVTVAAEAVQRGTDYDVKQNRIKTLLSTIDGIAGVYNPSDFEGGVADQTVAEFGEDIEELPLGNSLGTPGGIQAMLIRLEGGSIQDSSSVTPADVGVYERYSDTSLRMGIDVYVIGSRIGTAYDNYTTVGTETNVVLSQQPTLAVSSVLVNGTATTFTLTSDSSGLTRGSTSAQDYVTFVYPAGIAPGAGNSIYITYTYNKLIESLQDQVTGTEDDLFHADIMVREARIVPVTVEIVVESYGLGTRTDDVADWIDSWFKDPTGLTTRQKFMAETDPTDFREAIETDLGITLKSINQFNRPDKSTSDVQSISYSKNEYPVPTLTQTSS